MTTNNDDEQKTGNEVAKFALHPTANASLTLQEYCSTEWGEQASFESLSDELQRQISETCAGDKQHTIKTLASQVNILDMLFQTLCRRAIHQRPDGHVTMNTGYLSLALKCQKQSAATSAMLQYLIPDENSKNELSEISDDSEENSNE